MVYYWVSVLILTALLTYPVMRLVWVLSVRKLQRKLQRDLTTEELAKQKGRAYFIAILVCAVFSFLFNFRILP